MTESTLKTRQALIEANARLTEAVEMDSSEEIVRDGKIQRFEYTFELAWKFMGKILKENGVEAYGPKNIVREAAALGLIGNVELWLELQKSRNLTTHVYNRHLAEQIAQKADEFPKAIEDLLKTSEEYS